MSNGGPKKKETAKQIALRVCDEAFVDCLVAATDEYATCLTEVKAGVRATTKECMDQYERAIDDCFEAHDINLEVVEELFPEVIVSTQGSKEGPSPQGMLPVA